MQEVIKKSDLKKLSLERLDKWLEINHNRLIGSAVFTREETLTSRLVQWGEQHLFAKCDKGDFIPSHTGSIIEYKDDLYIFDMKPPKAAVKRLLDFIYSTQDDYVLTLRDFKLDTNMFSRNLIDRIGQSYPYLSALRSVFTKRASQWSNHCSELHYRQLLRQGIDFGINPECTPLELYETFIKGGRNE